MDQLRGGAPDDVCPQDLAVLLVPDDLHEAFGLPRPPRAPVRREGESSDDVVELALLALVLGETDARDLGGAVRHAGDGVVLDRVRLAPRDLLGHDHALAEPFVRQHRRAPPAARPRNSPRWRLAGLVLVL